MKILLQKCRRSNQREAVTLFIAQFIKHRIDRFDEGRSNGGTYRQRQRRC